jgi:hypothetical protein
MKRVQSLSARGIIMPLVRIPFAESLLPKVQSFDCGTEPWEIEVSDWIKMPEGAVADLKAGNQVWLFANEDGDLIGFGSLGEAQVRWPTAKDPRIHVPVIPMLGIDKRFWESRFRSSAKADYG